MWQSVCVCPNLIEDGWEVMAQPTSKWYCDVGIITVCPAVDCCVCSCFVCTIIGDGWQVYGTTSEQLASRDGEFAVCPTVYCCVYVYGSSNLHCEMAKFAACFAVDCCVPYHCGVSFERR